MFFSCLPEGLPSVPQAVRSAALLLVLLLISGGREPNARAQPAPGPVVWTTSLPDTDRLAPHSTAPRSRFLHWTYRDAGALLRDVGTHAPYFALLGGGLTYGARADAALQNEIQAAYDNSPALANALTLANLMGEREVALPVAGVFALSLTTDNTRFQDAAFTSLQSLLYATALTNVLKGTVGRSRPSVGNGPYNTEAFSGHTSFPSGHTTTAFAVLTPWVLYYPNGATYGLFAVGAGTATARVALDRHWPTDVVAGAAIGILTARYLTNRHRPSPTAAPNAPRLRITPLVGTDALGVGLRVHIP